LAIRCGLRLRATGRDPDPHRRDHDPAHRKVTPTGSHRCHNPIMRHLLALAVVAMGCGAAPPALTVHPAEVAATPDVAVAAARAVIDARYGIDPSAGNDHVIVGQAEWLDDAAWLAHRWERGV